MPILYTPPDVSHVIKHNHTMVIDSSKRTEIALKCINTDGTQLNDVIGSQANNTCVDRTQCIDTIILCVA